VLPSIQSAYFTVKMAADDHGSGTAYGYQLQVVTNGTTQLDGDVAGLQHGTPFGSPFTNYISPTYAVSTGSSEYDIFINNSSYGDGGNWIAFDSIELHLVEAAPVASTPEPGSIALLIGVGFTGLAAARRRKRSH
jgi:hypothetical protein